MKLTWMSVLGLATATFSGGVAAFSGAAMANELNSKSARPNHCASMGEGFVPIEGADGCFRIGGHVRVEAGVMRGTASLKDNVNSNAYAGAGEQRRSGELERFPVGRKLNASNSADEGLAPARLSNETTGTTRLHVRPMPGSDFFAR